MSIVTVLVEPGVVVVGTDSRFMRNNFAEVGDDGAQKIFEVTRDTFLAPSGWMLASKFQAEKAPEIARELDTHDIRAIAAVLDKASRPILELLVGMLASIPNPAPEISQTLDGSKPLQGFLLAGRSGGRLGYVWHEYVLRNWRIELTRHEFFDSGGGRHIWATGAQYLGQLPQDPRILTDEPIAVVKRFLETGRRATPHIGGPDQIVVIGRGGSNWITRPPSPASSAQVGHREQRDAKCELAASTLSAGIAINSPVMTVTGGSFSITINNSTGFTSSGGGTNINIKNEAFSEGGNGMSLESLSFRQHITPGFLGIYAAGSGTPYIKLDASTAEGHITALDSSGSSAVEINQSTSVGLVTFGGRDIVSSGVYRVGAASGQTGSFTSADGKTVTVTGGIITSIA